MGIIFYLRVRPLTSKPIFIMVLWAGPDDWQVLLTKMGIPTDSARTYAKTLVEESITKYSLTMINQVGHNSNCWYPQTGHLGIKQTLYFVRSVDPSSLSLRNVLIHWPGANALAEGEASSEEKLGQTSNWHSPLQQ